MLATKWLEHTNSWSDFMVNFYTQPPYAVWSFGIFFLILCVGLVGLSFQTSNLLAALIFGELLLIGLVFGFVISSFYLDMPVGGVYALFLLNIAAVESAVGMVLILNLFKIRGSIEYRSLQFLRG